MAPRGPYSYSQKLMQLAGSFLLVGVGVADVVWRTASSRTWLVMVAVGSGLALFLHALGVRRQRKVPSPERGVASTSLPLPDADRRGAAPWIGKSPGTRDRTNLASRIKFKITGRQGDAEFTKVVEFIPRARITELSEEWPVYDPSDRDRFTLSLDVLEYGKEDESGSSGALHSSTPEVTDGEAGGKVFVWPLRTPLDPETNRRYQKTLRGSFPRAFAYESGPLEFVTVQLKGAAGFLLEIEFDSQYVDTMSGDVTAGLTYKAWDEENDVEDMEILTREDGSKTVRVVITPCPGNAVLKVKWTGSSAA